MSETDVWAVPNEYSNAAALWVSDAVNSLSRELHPLLATVRREHVADLPRPDEHAPGAAELASPLHRDIEVSHRFTISVPDLVSGDVGSFLATVVDLADEFGRQMARGMLQHISDICDESGQTVSAAGRDLFDVIIESLETIDISFDEHGNHNLSLVTHPDTAREFASKTPTPEQQERMRAVLERRREEWDASRRRRDLP